jgi:hypothetical protein
MDDDELTYELSLAKASEWQKKASEATSPVLRQALDAVVRDYLRVAAEFKTRQVAAARH